jgi:hypothetical protein
MRILADLHGGGDPENEKAKREFTEIKDNIYADVGICSWTFLLTMLMLMMMMVSSAHLARGVISPCGIGIDIE